jgi:hypothetical protein
LLGAADGYVAKLSDAGSLQWIVGAGALGSSPPAGTVNFHQLAVSSNGNNLYVAGEEQLNGSSSVLFSNIGTLVNDGYGFVANFSTANGSFIWAEPMAQGSPSPQSWTPQGLTLQIDGTPLAVGYWNYASPVYDSYLANLKAAQSNNGPYEYQSASSGIETLTWYAVGCAVQASTNLVAWSTIATSSATPTSNGITMIRPNIQPPPVIQPVNGVYQLQIPMTAPYSFLRLNCP